MHKLKYIIRKRRLRWLGHYHRMSNDRIAKPVGLWYGVLAEAPCSNQWARKAQNYSLQIWKVGAIITNGLWTLVDGG